MKPERVRPLLIAESAPDEGGDIANDRYFDDVRLTGKGGLIRQIVRATYDDPALKSGQNEKTPWLERLKSHGVSAFFPSSSVA